MNSIDKINARIDHGHFSASQVMVVVVALMLYMLDGFDIAAMAFTAHRIGEAMQVAPEQLGIAFGAALAGMMFGAMFLAPKSDLIGRRKIILMSVTVIGVSMISTALIASLWHLIVARFITGLGIGAMLASLTTINSEYTPIKYRSMAVVIVLTGYPLGATIGGFIAAPLMATYGWESVFLVAGAATISMLFLVYFLIPESIQFLAVKRPADVLTKINKILIRMRKEPLDTLPEIIPNTQPTRVRVFSLLSQQFRTKTLVLWACCFFCLMCLYFMMSWIPKLVINSGLSEAEGVYASMAFTGGGVIGTVVLGILTTRMGLTNVISSFLLCSALFMLLFYQYSDSLNLFYSLTFIGFLFTSGYTGLYAVAAKIYPTEIRTTGVGWAVGVSRFGAVAGPYFGGILVASNVSMESSFLILATPIALGGIMAWYLKIK